MKDCVYGMNDHPDQPKEAQASQRVEALALAKQRLEDETRAKLAKVMALRYARTLMSD